MPLNESRYINKANTSVDDKAFDSMIDADNSDATHAALAVAGMAPGPTGMVADITDAALYAKEKRWKDMGWALLGAIPILGNFSSYKKIAKSMEATRSLKRMAKYERMKEGIENGSLLFANKKWQKLIDEGKISIDESGAIWGRTGGSGAMWKTGHIGEMSQFERYDDFYKLQSEIMKDHQKIWKSLSPKEKATAKEFGKSPTMTKQLRDMVLKLEKLLPSGD